MNQQKIICLILFGFLLYSCIPESKDSVDKNGKDHSQYTIGAVLPLSGKNAEYGIWIKQSLELARGEINERGGIRMANLTIIYEDDQCSSSTAATVMQKLVEVDHVPIVFGSWCSSSALAMAPIAQSHQVVMMAEAMSPKIRDAGDFVFRIQPDASKYAVELAQYAEKNGYKHPAILGVDNEFGRGYAESFADAFMGGGSKQSIPREYYDVSTMDFRIMLEKLAYQQNADTAKDGPDVFVVPAYTEISLILKQMSELNISIPLLSAPPFENQDILNAVGGLANGVVYPHHFDPEDPIAHEFDVAYAKKYGSPAEGYAALAYDGIFVLAKAMQTCDRETACIRDVLYNISYSGVTGMTSFDDHGDVDKPIIMKIVSNGSFVRLR